MVYSKDNEKLEAKHTSTRYIQEMKGGCSPTVMLNTPLQSNTDSSAAHMLDEYVARLLCDEDGRLRVLSHLSYHQLEKISTDSKIMKRLKYPNSVKKPRSLAPGLRRSFPNRESLLYFFRRLNTTDALGRRITRPSSSKLLLLKMFFYALRVGEANSATYNPYTRLVRVETEKAGQPCIDYIPFIEGTEVLFTARKVSPAVLQKVFRRHCNNLGAPYNEKYIISGAGALYRLTPHSLRITASNYLRHHTRDPYKQKVFLRHSISRSYGATSHYLEYSEDDFRVDLQATFAPLVKALLSP